MNLIWLPVSLLNLWHLADHFRSVEISSATGAFADTAQSLGRGGASLRADLFPGRSHEVSDAEIAMLGTIIADLEAGRGARMGAAR